MFKPLTLACLDANPEPQDAQDAEQAPQEEDQAVTVGGEEMCEQMFHKIGVYVQSELTGCVLSVALWLTALQPLVMTTHSCKI